MKQILVVMSFEVCVRQQLVINSLPSPLLDDFKQEVIGYDYKQTVEPPQPPEPKEPPEPGSGTCGTINCLLEKIIMK